MTPSLRFSKTSYASSILESGKRWVIRGVVSIFPWDIKSRISPQSHPSTPPVLKMRFLPYISGSGSICGLSYIATMVTMALGRAHFQASWKCIRSTCNLHHHISSPMQTMLFDKCLTILRFNNHHLRIMLLDELSPIL